MPLTRIMANIMTAAPPSTDWGMTDSSADSLGQKPHRIRNTAPVMMQKRFTTLVTPTRPTFWLKEVLGRTPNREARKLPRPSATTPPESSLVVGSRFRPPLAIPEMSPTVSTAVATYIISMATIACQLNSIATGIKLGRLNQAASATGWKSTIFRQIATI